MITRSFNALPHFSERPYEGGPLLRLTSINNSKLYCLTQDMQTSENDRIDSTESELNYVLTNEESFSRR